MGDRSQGTKFAASAGTPSERLKDNYVSWKSWEPGRGTDDERDAYIGEIEQLGVHPGARILEIGFGSGSFMLWARSAGFTVVGVEVIPELVDWATLSGFEATLAKEGSPLGQQTKDSFDAIVAFDVLEHMDQGTLLEFAAAAATCLKSGGRILARFPNGSSPLGRHFQHGDLTHASTLNSNSIEQLFRPLGFELTWSRDSYIPRGRNWTRRAVRSLKHCCRKAIGIAVSQLYWGTSVPLGPNLTVCLTRTE